MKTFVRLFLSSAMFGVVITVIYYVCSHGEWAGTIMVGTMAIGLTFAASYAIVAERDADVDGDHAPDNYTTAAGEYLGVYTSNSAWPILLAFAVLLVFIGALWVPFLLFTGITAMLLILWRLEVESSRIV